MYQLIRRLGWAPEITLPILRWLHCCLERKLKKSENEPWNSNQVPRAALPLCSPLWYEASGNDITKQAHRTVSLISVSFLLSFLSELLYLIEMPLQRVRNSPTVVQTLPVMCHVTQLSETRKLLLRNSLCTSVSFPY